MPRERRESALPVQGLPSRQPSLLVAIQPKLRRRCSGQITRNGGAKLIQSIIRRIAAGLRHRGRKPGEAFETWKASNPDGTFKQFYAESVVARLGDDRAHSSLGGRLKPKSRIVTRRLLGRLISLGLRPDDTVVDYGCGTLRVGAPLIAYLDANRYIGMDIDARIIAAGRNLLPDDLLDAKKPILEVISSGSVERAVAVAPNWVLSVGVLQHVHPEELSTYLGDISRFVHAGATAIITHKPGDDRQLFSRTWSYSLGRLRDAAGPYELTIDRVEIPDRHGQWRPLILRSSSRRDDESGRSNLIIEGAFGSHRRMESDD